MRSALVSSFIVDAPAAFLQERARFFRPQHRVDLMQHYAAPPMLEDAMPPRAVFPDPQRLPPRAHVFQFFAMPPFPPATIPIFWTPSYPDAALRALAPVRVQPFFAMAPQPEEAVQLEWQPNYPDRAPRARTPANAHLFFAVPPQPEERVQLDWAPLYPDRSPRAKVHAIAQPFFAMAPQPEDVTPLDWQPNYPDRAQRFLAPARVQPFFAMATQPEERIQLEWAPSYPDRIPRATQPIAARVFFATSPQPEQPLQIAAPSYPDRIDRPVFRAERQLAFAAGFRPEEAVQLEWQPQFPERIPRPTFVPARQQWLAMHPNPERAPLDFQPHFPDRALRAPSRPQLARDFSAYPTPVVVVVAPNITATIYPDRAPRRFLPAALRQSFAFVAGAVFVQPQIIPIARVRVMPLSVIDFEIDPAGVAILSPIPEALVTLSPGPEGFAVAQARPLVGVTITLPSTMIRTGIPALIVIDVTIAPSMAPTDAAVISAKLLTPGGAEVDATALGGTITHIGLGKYALEATFAIAGEWKVRALGQVDTFFGTRNFESEPFLFRVLDSASWSPV